eukprot:GILI01010381.1.p1 GENE.GILI01010381.1~~GILI01010381.1.p1  ORF type:complete len:231 (+),score=33.51 GILI01010381.1:52-744(+)
MSKILFALFILGCLLSVNARIVWCDIYNTDPALGNSEANQESRAELKLLSRELGVPRARLNGFGQWPDAPAALLAITNFLQNNNCPHVFVRVGGTAGQGTNFRAAPGGLLNTVSISSVDLATAINAVNAPAIYITSCLCNRAAITAHEQANRVNLNVLMCARKEAEVFGLLGGPDCQTPTLLASTTFLAWLIVRLSALPPLTTMGTLGSKCTTPGPKRSLRTLVEQFITL